MVFTSKIFAPLFTIALAAVANASPVELNSLSQVTKRTPGNVYICPQTGFGGDCTTISAANECNNLPGWQYDIQSIGPDEGATCYAYSEQWCGTGGSVWTFTYPGDPTGGWATANPWALAVASIYCDIGTSSPPPPPATSYSGFATYYTPDGGFGACGWPIQTSDMAVAIGIDHWDGGSHCGATMTVTYQGATVEAIVADQCPTCGTNGVDLTQDALATIDPNWHLHGNDSVTWSVSF
ncbi:Non-Catalytic module family EXPN protein [Mycena sanguinolenta]|uniref:Non-Catalytic module family EXPN protein n=1 Tax=Mycena sanguinolenta TaxID=230812 RepID=A0A8H7D4C1_9AGAR|nr:Non-Catalytic module family EXPN protein [Mycena sanguinolenta]